MPAQPPAAPEPLPASPWQRLHAALYGRRISIKQALLAGQAVVGVGNADKTQVHAMVQRLLPGAKIAGPDAADALAVAITHAHHLASARATQNRST